MPMETGARSCILSPIHHAYTRMLNLAALMAYILFDYNQ